MKLMRSRARGEHGQSMAEFALVAPIFFLLLFTVIQLGIIFGAQNGLVNGVREAARRAATYRINDQSFDASVWTSICDTVKTEVEELGDRTIPAYTVANLHGGLPSGAFVAYEWMSNPEANEWFLAAHVSAKYDHQLYVPLVSWFFDGTDGSSDGYLTLSASEQMRVENPALEFTGTPPAVPPCPAYP